MPQFCLAVPVQSVGCKVLNMRGELGFPDWVTLWDHLTSRTLSGKGQAGYTQTYLPCSSGWL